MSNRSHIGAFTRRELVVVITVIVALFVLLVPVLQRSALKSRSLCCNCNFKQIGAAYRIWSNDHGDLNPALAAQTNGGWSDRLAEANPARYCWTNYAILSNEVGQSTLILVCPSDIREAAKTFSDLAGNSNISYYVGVTANDAYPQSMLGGDRNLCPGTAPDKDYGYSPANGNGNDVIITNQVCWSLKMHSAGNPAGFGNILLGDGSAQQVNSQSLYQDWVRNAFAGVTNPPPLRIIFP
jgi:competence protein ComGC